MRNLPSMLLWGRRYMRLALPLILGMLVMKGADWPSFRGLNGSGVSEAAGLPVEFGKSNNLIWKAVVPAGVSSPVLLANSIFITAASGNKRLVIALDSRTGKRLWERSIEVTAT